MVFEHFSLLIFLSVSYLPNWPDFRGSPNCPNLARFLLKVQKKSGHFQFSPKTYIKIRQNPCIFVLQGLNLSFRKWFSDPWIWYLEKFSTRKLYIFDFIQTNDVDHEFDDQWKKATDRSMSQNLPLHSTAIKFCLHKTSTFVLKSWNCPNF